ncbi:MAG: hypothetical protein BGO54_21925 [Sphingobacteriales bacterium 46-32]|nr:MAG: hypothetical protein BGO54_21925 [Sphingobacteriales bacterium 46-32]
MQNHSQEPTSGLLEEFRNLDYQGKVRLFDKEFGIVPFEFPEYDIEASWYRNELKTSQFIDIFHQDSRDNNLLQKNFQIEKEMLSFDIRPLSKLERIYLNQYILQKFLDARQTINDQVKRDIEVATDEIKYLEARIDTLVTVVNWTKYTLEQPGKSSFRIKFLTIFYNGFKAYNYGNDKMITIRRKFLELFLYAQGLLLAEHLGDLQKTLEKYRDEKETKNELSLPLKIVLLKELGIIETLKQKFKQRHIEGYHNQLADLICLITSENRKNHQSVLDYVTALDTGTSTDLLNPANVKTIKEELEKYQLA